MSITVQQVTRNIRVNQQPRDIKVRQVSRTINVKAGGRRGPQGVQGIQGPPGDPATGDKTYSLDFTNSSEVTVTHNLGKLPAVTINDSTGDEVEGQVEHLSINQLVTRFSSSFTGKIVCN
jgi:hypothetical protein